MKKLILILLSVAILIGAGLLTLAIVYKYENIKEEKALQEEQRKTDMNARVAQAKAGLENQVNAIKGEYNQLHAECLKGRASYDLLTSANKRKVQEPACGSVK